MGRMHIGESPPVRAPHNISQPFFFFFFFPIRACILYHTFNVENTNETHPRKNTGSILFLLRPLITVCCVPV